MGNYLSTMKDQARFCSFSWFISEPLYCSINTLLMVKCSPAISYRQKTSGQMSDSKLLLTNSRKEMLLLVRAENLHENISHANYYFSLIVPKSLQLDVGFHVTKWSCQAIWVVSLFLERAGLKKYIMYSILKFKLFVFKYDCRHVKLRFHISQKK